MDPGRPLAGDSAELEAGGHRPVAAVGGRVDGGLLQDVGGIEAASLPEVEPGPADPVEPGAVAPPGRGEREPVASGGAAEALGVVRGLAHGDPSTGKYARRGRSSRGRR
jgi:hypothetical protein